MEFLVRAGPARLASYLLLGVVVFTWGVLAASTSRVPPPAAVVYWLVLLSCSAGAAGVAVLARHAATMDRHANMRADNMWSRRVTELEKSNALLRSDNAKLKAAASADAELRDKLTLAETYVTQLQTAVTGKIAQVDAWTQAAATLLTEIGQPSAAVMPDVLLELVRQDRQEQVSHKHTIVARTLHAREELTRELHGTQDRLRDMELAVKQFRAGVYGAGAFLGLEGDDAEFSAALPRAVEALLDERDSYRHALASRAASVHTVHDRVVELGQLLKELLDMPYDLTQQKETPVSSGETAGASDAG